jgi:glucose 1-dehydrogenase
MTTSYPEFQGKRVLITGGTQGIGKAIAARLVKHGAVVYLNYFSHDDAARETLAEFKAQGATAELCKADLSQTESVESMLDHIHKSGPLDHLVCNAAYQEKNRGLFETDVKLLRKTFEVNVISNFLLIQRVAREMIAHHRRGSMAIASSGQGRLVMEGTLAYAVSKAALNHFMAVAALDLIENNIRLNAVEIGWTHTPGERRWFTEEEQTRLSRTIPIGRAAQADEIAAVFEFLLSEQASYIVGSLYGADGGFMLRPNPET